MMTEETRVFALAHADEDVHRLLLQAGQYPGVDMTEAVTQIEGRRTARVKLPSWADNERIVFPPRLAMEQCSSEATARYKARLCGERLPQDGRPHTLTDLTGGLGVDCAFMSAAFDDVTYVERQPHVAAVAAHNFGCLGCTAIHPLTGDGVALLDSLPTQDWIFLDPARRDGAGRKVVALADCEPDVARLEDTLLAHAQRVMVKCSPMLDISLACRQLHSVREIYVVALQNECKELLLLLGSDDGEPLRLHAVSLRGNGDVESELSFTADEERDADCPYAEGVGRYLFEPGVAVLKAGCVRLLPSLYGVQKLQANSHLYTADNPCADFPGRQFEVVGSTGFGKRELREFTKDMTQANLAVRNFPESVDTLRKRLRLQDGGDDYLFATTLQSGQHRLIRCHKVQK